MLLPPLIPCLDALPQDPEMLLVRHRSRLPQLSLTSDKTFYGAHGLALLHGMRDTSTPALPGER
jgi:hypothetical protein